MDSGFDMSQIEKLDGENILRDVISIGWLGDDVLSLAPPVTRPWR